ncbi:uncharacterized protein PV09_04903 [Verruconis gallopava]|uniref:Aquaporin n=1 Tax=Verruconis gallopava TaxID=253628 RepID=A0A0D1XND4_9PEZI|nr:uncharacterized protein PV09_04903 [Verruconis gallopava]KIW04086.1 hypothetical protein PV09_04903 [Verruconis gallopava]
MNNIEPADNPAVALPFTNRQKSDTPAPKTLPAAHHLSPRTRNEVVAFLGEFVGTFLFLFFAFAGTQVANMVSVLNLNMKPDISILLYISLSFGFSLTVNVWVFFRISGGLFNPAVSLGLALIGAIGFLRMTVAIIAQILGAIAAAALVSGLFPGPLLVRTTLSVAPKTSVVRGLFIEMFCTALLIFTIFMLAAEKHKGTFLAPVGIGLCLFVCELAAVLFTGGSLNPARSFGPDVVVGKFASTHWIYWLGPFLGAVVSVLFYRFIKMLEYETANPGADATRPNSPNRGLPSRRGVNGREDAGERV